MQVTIPESLVQEVLVYLESTLTNGLDFTLDQSDFGTLTITFLDTADLDEFTQLYGDRL